MENVGFLFDNDGVLIDSQKFHWLSWKRLIEEERGFVLNRETFIGGFGKRNDLILKEAVPHLSDEERRRLANRKEELFREIARESITLLPGMEEFLKVIVKADIPHIIASSTPPENLEMFLAATVLGKYFNAFVSAEQVAHGKPAPDVFIAAAHKLGFAPDECIVVEDAPAGIEAGKAAGCFVVALETTHRKESLQKSDMIFPSPHDLDLDAILAYFAKWKAKQKV